MGAELLKMTEPGEWNQFWLGGKTTGRHDPDHNQGEWNWPHMNKTVDWFDWGDGQPNDWHNENCLVLREYHRPLFPQDRTTSGMIGSVTRQLRILSVRKD